MSNYRKNLKTKRVRKLDEFTRSFLETAIWHGDEEGGFEGLDFTLRNFTHEAITKAVNQCRWFQDRLPELNIPDNIDMATLGMDFFMDDGTTKIGFCEPAAPYPKRLRNELRLLASGLPRWIVQVRGKQLSLVGRDFSTRRSRRR